MHCFAHFPSSSSLPRIDWQVGPCITLFEACSAFTHVAACVLAKSPSDPLHRRLQPFRYLHDCSDCFRPEQKWPGGIRTRWKSANFARRTSNSGAPAQETRLCRLAAGFIQWEEDARAQRSLERRIGAARIGRFKALADFDWSWPTQCDRGAVEGLMGFEFIKDGANVVLRGPNGVGKSMLARNVAHQALVHGHTVRFTTAGELLGDLAALDSDAALRRRLRHYATPDLLVIDEIGYLSYSNRHADLLFELVNQRYESKSTMVTTNKAFGE